MTLITCYMKRTAESQKANIDSNIFLQYFRVINFTQACILTVLRNKISSCSEPPFSPTSAILDAGRNYLCFDSNPIIMYQLTQIKSRYKNIVTLHSFASSLLFHWQTLHLKSKHFSRRRCAVFTNILRNSTTVSWLSDSSAVSEKYLFLVTITLMDVTR